MSNDFQKEIQQLHLAYRQIGGLVTYAEQDRQSSEALKRELGAAVRQFANVSSQFSLSLKTHIQDALDPVMNDLGADLRRDFQGTIQAAQAAQASFQQAAKFSFFKIALTAAAVGIVALLTVFLTARIYFPSYQELSDRKKEFDQIGQEIQQLKELQAELVASGILSDIRKCKRRNGELVPCAKFDESNPDRYEGGYRELLQ